MSILDRDPESVLERIVEATRDLEFRTFVLGIERPANYTRPEHESAFRRLKIALGNRLCGLWPHRDVDFQHPELRIDLRGGGGGLSLDLQLAPLFIGGRYRKLSREIPACRWMHMRCKGKGCRNCGFTGNICGPSIQELAEPAVLAASGGAKTLFHGAGREDVDVRMLGAGRPFVLEVHQPRWRRLDLEALTRQINLAAAGIAEVHALSFTDRGAMVAAKMCEAEKTYRAWIAFEGPVPADLEERLGKLCGARIEQLSPTRVMKRRGVDTLREKKVLESSLIGEENGLHIWEVRTSSGTYIKELVSGDGGRTSPSVASAAGVRCRCAWLDVLDIHWRAPWEPS